MSIESGVDPGFCFGGALAGGLRVEVPQRSRGAKPPEVRRILRCYEAVKPLTEDGRKKQVHMTNIV